jgi:hypothetical protein
MWYIPTGDAYGPKVTRNYECRFLDLVSDISWNPRYNMFALCGFGHHFPVMVYVYQRTEEQLNEILYSSTAAGLAHQDSTMAKTDYSSLPGTGRVGLSLGGKENEHLGNVNVRAYLY